MIRDKRPRYAGIVANVITAMQNMPALAGCVAFDEMALRVVLRRALPGEAPITEPRPWADADTTQLQDWLQRHAEMSRVGKGAVDQGVDRVAREHKFHPIRNYLTAQKWDGKRRLNTWLSRYLGVKWSRYAAKTGRWWMIGMVARIMKPGCQFENMLILEGPQGAGKSRAARILCEPWFDDRPLNLREDLRATSQHLRGVWLHEFSELVAFRSADVELLKAFLSLPVEDYIPRYGHSESHEPRQCGFIGTTNADTYLHDASGGRRFWPNVVGIIDLAALKRDRGQLWAEALAAREAGEQWWADAKFEQQYVQPEQEARYDADGWTPLVESYLTEFEKATKTAQDIWDKQTGTKTPRSRPIVQTTLIEVFRKALRDPPSQHDIAPEKFTPQAQQRMRAILLRLGWRLGGRSASHRWWIKP
jgi:predicted P-loop ATPase